MKVNEPKPTQRTTIELDWDLWLRLKKISLETGVSMKDIMAAAIERDVKKIEKALGGRHG